eukprot:scaffold4656_cov117-Isochrysis_galbana.AAC.19
MCAASAPSCSSSELCTLPLKPMAFSRMRGLPSIAPEGMWASESGCCAAVSAQNVHAAAPRLHGRA